MRSSGSAAWRTCSRSVDPHTVPRRASGAKGRARGRGDQPRRHVPHRRGASDSLSSPKDANPSGSLIGVRRPLTKPSGVRQGLARAAYSQKPSALDRTSPHPLPEHPDLMPRVNPDATALEDSDRARVVHREWGTRRRKRKRLKSGAGPHPACRLLCWSGRRCRYVRAAEHAVRDRVPSRADDVESGGMAPTYV